MNITLGLEMQRLRIPDYFLQKKIFLSVKKRLPGQIPKAFIAIMKLLSSSSSTVSLLQPFDPKLALNLLGFLKNKQDFVEDVGFSQELQLKHPYVFNIINNIRICD